jgi:hypothetical protein
MKDSINISKGIKILHDDIKTIKKFLKDTVKEQNFPIEKEFRREKGFPKEKKFRKEKRSFVSKKTFIE